ncbi:serine hydrolase domain-containing protein [Gemmatimonas sp.]|uniref:serine hydrolase domain-containing protein n=1 Tax=Gemmatimonas sp. TaxID=1962908 RepID=UPI0033419799
MMRRSHQRASRHASNAVTAFVWAGARALLLLSVLADTAQGQQRTSADQRPASDATIDSIVALAKRRFAQSRIPGGVLGIWHSGRVSVRAWGVTSADDAIPVTEHTVFPIASIPKTVTATAIMRLVDPGKIELDAPVRRYLPDFTLAPSVNTDRVTVAQLLTHLGGWFGQVPAPDVGQESLQRFVSSASSLEQISDPGNIWGYNNAGFTIAGRLIEVVTGTSIDAAIKQLVFAPLRLTHAGTSERDFITQRFALGHQVIDGRAVVSRPFSTGRTVTAGGTGMCMSDLMQFAAFHLQDGKGPSGEQLLHAETALEMRRPRVQKEGNDEFMGVAWHLPERQLAIGIFSNTGRNLDTLVAPAWRVIEEIERTAIERLTGATLPANAAIGHRGIFGSIPSPMPLLPQPDLSAYVGSYRFPKTAVTAENQNGVLRLQMQRLPGSLLPTDPLRLQFIGTDRAIILNSGSRGQSVEFLRDSTGRVGWLRLQGRAIVRDR